MKQVVCLALLFSLLFAGCFAIDEDCEISSSPVLTDNSGTFGCLNPTGLNIDIIWEISPNNGSISLTFDFINFDFGFDELTIIDGDYSYEFLNPDVTSYQSINDKLQIVYYSNFDAPISEFSISYVALGDPCSFSQSRTIDNSPREIVCEPLAKSITSSWSVVTVLPAAISFESLGDVTFTIRDGPSALDPIIYQGSASSPVDFLYSSKPNFYVEVSTVDGGSFSLTYDEINLCDFDSGYTPVFTAPSGTISCSGDVTNLFSFYSTIGQAVEFQITELTLSNPDSVNFYDPTGDYSYSRTDSTLPPVVVVSGSPALSDSVIFSFDLYSQTSSFTIAYRFVTNPCTNAGVLTLSYEFEGVSCNSVIDNVPSTYEAGYLITTQNDAQFVALRLNSVRGTFAFNIFEGTSADGGLLYQYSGDGYTDSDNFYSTGPMYIQLLVDAEDVYSYTFNYDIVTTTDPCLESGYSNRYALFGTISCPSLSSDSLDSYWFILPGQGQISIEFNEFDLDVGSELRFYDFDSENLLNTFTSASPPKDFTSTSTALVAELYIPGTMKRGPPFTFSFTYTAAASACQVSTNLLVIDESGSFGCPAGFGPNLHSTWLIAPHNGQIEYTVTKLKLLVGFPGLFINIYDGYNNTGLLLKTIVPGEHYLDPDNQGLDYYYSNGEKISGLSISDAIFVEFYSDSQTPAQGLSEYFEIQYSTLGDICGSSLEAILTEPKGVFGCATGLNDNIRSTWLISPQNDEVTLVFLKLDLEDGFDFVEIFDGSGPTSPSLGIFTGDTIPFPNYIKSSSDSLYVVVTTDPSSNSGGFEFAYLSGVGNPCLSDYNVTLTSEFGEFGCANGIQNDIHSFWTITVPSDQGAVIASFTEFSLQLDSDFLYVYDGDSSNAKLLATLTGSNLPDDIISSGRSLYFLLVTDKSIRSQGFYVKYTSIQSDPCQTSQFTQLSKNADSFGCSEGSIAPEIKSTWLILPNNRNIITLSFSVFNLHSGDFIRIYDGDNDAAPLLGSFSGSRVPSFVVSTGGEMLVVLETGILGQSVGFRASYTTNQADSCATSTENTLVASTGNLGCPNGVKNNIQSSWLIAPLSNNRIEITIEFVDLAAGDILTIYDGSSEQAPVLAQYTTGIVTFKTVMSSHSVALVVIRTNGNTESNGFNINYVTAIPPSPSLRPFVPSASRTPIDFSFTPSPSLVPVTPSQTPVTLTPWVIAPTTTRSISVAPSPSRIVGSIVPSVTSTHSESASRSVPPSPVIVAPSSSSSNLPQFSITPFSPSANPSVSTTANPIRVISDVETLTVQLECRTSGATCCNNFETVWASTEDSNYPTLIDVNSCIYNDGTVTVKFDQYGSNHFSSEEIIRNYWDDGGCSRKDPFTGEECSVSTSALDTNIWRTQIMVVNSIPATPSPLPSYYYYAASSTSESSVLSGLVSLLFVALTILYLAF